MLLHEYDSPCFGCWGIKKVIICCSACGDGLMSEQGFVVEKIGERSIMNIQAKDEPG